MIKSKLTVAVSVAVAAGFAAAVALASDPIVYPAKGQSEQKMQKDKSECRTWAQKQTGVDPSAQVPQASSEHKPTGKRVAGAGRGAAAGAVGGAIAGDAGKGAAIGAAVGEMKGGAEVRKERRADRKEQKEAEAAHEQGMQTYNRAYCACLEGRGYTVK